MNNNFCFVQRELLVKRLEIVMANAICASYRPTIVALTLLQTDIELTYFNNIPADDVDILHLLACLLQLQHVCMVINSFAINDCCVETFIQNDTFQIVTVDFNSCYKKIIYTLEEYDDHRKICHGQKLEWRFSTCTTNASKPSEHFTSSLTPVKESETTSN